MLRKILEWLIQLFNSKNAIGEDTTNGNTLETSNKEGTTTDTNNNENSIQYIEKIIGEEQVYKLNVSEGKANYSQRKSKLVHDQKGQYGTNRIDWKVVCNVHSIAMALLYSGWVFPKSNYEREPDALGDFIIKECLKDDNWFKQKMPTLWRNWYEGDPKAYTPLELHEVLAHYVNEYFGCSNTDKFYDSLDIKEVFKQLYERNIAIPTSVQWGGLLGHVITIVGFEASSENSLIKWLDGQSDECPITKVIIDDPWGLYDEKIEKYDGNKSGNDVEISYEHFVKHWKNVNSSVKKFAHIISKPVSCV